MLLRYVFYAESMPFHDHRTLKARLKKIQLAILCFLGCLPSGLGQRGNNAILTDPLLTKLYEECVFGVEEPFRLDKDCLLLTAGRQFSGSLTDQYELISYAMIKEERAFHLESAAGLAERLVLLGRDLGDSTLVANAYQNLYRYMGAIGREEESLAHLEKAIALWSYLGVQEVVLRNQFSLLEMRSAYLPLDSLYQEMELLLAEAKKAENTKLMEYMHTRMVSYAYTLGEYGNMERHLDYLANLPVSDPIQPMEYGYVIIHARGRAYLAQARGKIKEARRWYLRALALCRQEPSLWLEVDLLQSLAELEWQVGNKQNAYFYLDTASILSDERDMYDLQAENFAILKEYATEAGDYQAALDYFQDEVKYRNLFAQRSAGFDVQNAILEREKKELALIKERQELALKRKTLQLRMVQAGSVFVIFFVASIVWGLINQRQKQRRLAQQNKIIQEQAERLSNLDALKSQFFANASHELRTPLGLMLGPLRSLEKDDSLSQQQNQLLGIAKKAGLHMNQLVNDILDLTKMDDHYLSISSEPTQLGSFLAAQCHSWMESGRQQGKSFAYDIQIPSHMQVALDRRKVQQILNNLLSNAFKFTPTGGSVSVEAEESKDKLQVLVKDTGSGISQEDMPFIFDRYFQSNDPQKVTTGGSGIGLALSKELAELMGGSLEVISVPDAATVFRLVLPLAKVHVEVKPSAKPQPLQGAYCLGELEKVIRIQPQTVDPNRSEILIVDDNADLRMYLEMILKPMYELVLTANGAEALTYLQNAQKLPDLILTDLMMPVLDGFGLIDAVKKDPAFRHLPFIMLTARAQARTKLKALRVGVDDYLTLPFDEQELRARIDNVLSHQAVRRATAKSLNQTDTSTQSNNLVEQLSKADQEWLQTFEAFAKKNLNEDTLSVPRLAQEFAMSESTLLRQLKRLTGLTPVKYLQELRLDLARELMESSDQLSVQKVASEIGYRDVRSFSRVFKKRFGVSPSEYNESN